jgi:putative phosphoesterase
MTIVGVISDTHGLLRPEAREYLADADLIVHAGDIGSPDVITALQAIAPVTAIRGNIDKGPWSQGYSDTATLEVAGKRLYVLHSLRELDLDPVAAGFDVVISGHSHMPKVEETEGVLYLNPGSAGRRRFKLPIAVAKLFVEHSRLAAEVYEITPRT